MEGFHDAKSIVDLAREEVLRDRGGKRVKSLENTRLEEKS